MAKRRGKRREGPSFPRKQWTAGQGPRVEQPKKGKGAYRRGTEGGRAIDEALDDRRGSAG